MRSILAITGLGRAEAKRQAASGKLVVAADTRVAGPITGMTTVFTMPSLGDPSAQKS